MEVIVGNPPILVKVFIPMGAKKIATLVSGGADSAILTYMLARESHKYNVELLTYTVPRTDGAINYSPAIVEKISSMTGISIPPPVEIGDPHRHHSDQTRSGHRQLLVQHPEIDYIYYGSQKVAPELENIPELAYPWRPERMFYPGKTICPFYNLTKEHTLELYYKLEVTELLKYSHSCAVWSVGRCGKCYNCLERSWAFGKLGKIDPGHL